MNAQATPLPAPTAMEERHQAQVKKYRDNLARARYILQFEAPDCHQIDAYLAAWKARGGEELTAQAHIELLYAVIDAGDLFVDESLCNEFHKRKGGGKDKGRVCKRWRPLEDRILVALCARVARGALDGAWDAFMVEWSACGGFSRNGQGLALRITETVNGVSAPRKRPAGDEEAPTTKVNFNAEGTRRIRVLASSLRANSTKSSLAPSTPMRVPEDPPVEAPAEPPAPPPAEAAPVLTQAEPSAAPVSYADPCPACGACGVSPQAPPSHGAACDVRVSNPGWLQRQAFACGLANVPFDRVLVGLPPDTLTRWHKSRVDFDGLTCHPEFAAWAMGRALGHNERSRAAKFARVPRGELPLGVDDSPREDMLSLPLLAASLLTTISMRGEPFGYRLLRQLCERADVFDGDEGDAAPNASAEAR